jgi:hypothetical protein
MIVIQKKFTAAAWKKTKLFFLVLICCVSLNASAQEMWGYANSNYAGIMGLHLNPASIVGVPYEYEVNILAGDVFYDNNYLYLPKLSDVNAKTTTAEDGTKTNTTTFVEYNNPSSKHAFAHGRILGPSYIRNKNTSAWAVHTSLRAIASANGVPSSLTKAVSTDFNYAPLHNVVFTDMKIHAAGILVGGIGATYARVYMNQSEHWLAWGITLNGLAGFDGAYLHAEAGEYSIPDSTSLALNHVNLDYAHALPGENSGLMSIKGFGASGDIGLVYIHKRNQSAYECGKDADRRKRYNYKIGVSLIDLGYVHFNRGSARSRLNDGTIQWNNIDTVKFNGLEDFDTQLNAHAGGDVIATDRFGIFMPAAASVQFDYCLKPRWYANLGFVQRIPYSPREIYRANSIALVPRYETRRFEASVSANMYEYEHLTLGASVRYLFFVLGTDRLLSFVGPDVRSLDLFFGFKFNSCMLMKKYKNKGACPMNG